MKLFKLSLLTLCLSSFTLVGFATYSATEGTAPAFAQQSDDSDKLYEKNIGAGQKIDIDSSGAGIRDSDSGVRFGIQNIPDPTPVTPEPTHEQRGDTTFNDTREPSSIGIGIDVDID